MQKKRMSDYDISLMLTLISIPVWLPTLFVWSFLPIELVPQFINFFVLWLPVIWQMVSCFFAIRYIRQNPDKQKKGAGCLAIVLWVYMIDAFLSLIATGITYNTWQDRKSVV